MSKPYGILSIEELTCNAKSMGIKKLGITERNSIETWDKFGEFTLKNDIEPIYGVEINLRRIKYYLLAKNSLGLDDIIQLYYDHHLFSEIPFFSMLSDCYIIYPIQTLRFKKIRLSFNEYIGLSMHDILIGSFELIDVPSDKIVYTSNVTHCHTTKIDRLIDKSNSQVGIINSVESITNGSLMIPDKILESILSNYPFILNNTKQISMSISYK